MIELNDKCSSQLSTILVCRISLDSHGAGQLLSSEDHQCIVACQASGGVHP